MTFSSIVPIVLVLAAPAASPVGPGDRAPTAEEPAPEGLEADEVQPAPDEADEADEAQPAPGEADEAQPAPETIPNPFAAPPTTAVVRAPPPVAAPTRPPRPIRWRLDFGLGVGTTVARDPGVRAFSRGRSLPDTGASALFDFRLAEGRFFLGGGVSYQNVNRRGDANAAQITSKLGVHEPQVLGRVSFMVLEGLDAFARVGVGPSIVDMRVQSEAYETASQRAIIPRVDGRAGLSLYLPKKWLPSKQASRVTAGLDLGLGYTWRGKIEVRPTLEQDDEPLRATTSPWGTLSMHGLSFGMGLFLRVM